jgi:hypothetical protein
VKKIIMVTVFGMMAVIALMACPPSPSTPSQDAGDSASAPPTPPPPPGTDTAALACQNLASIKCSDGLAPDCAAVLRAVQASGKFAIYVSRANPPGLLESVNLTQARAAGAKCQ